VIDAPGGPHVRPWRGRFVVLVGVVLVALNLRLAVGAVSPIVDAIRRDVALSGADVGVLGTVPVLSFALFGSVAPLVARRIGLEPSLVLAMLLSAAGEVLRSRVGSSGDLVAWSVLALAGMGMGNVLLPPVVKRYFPDRIGAATAAYSVAMSVSAAVPPLIAVPLAERLGWRMSLASWAVVGLVAVVPWLVVVARSANARSHLREILRRAPSDTSALAARHRGGGRVWRSPLTWGLTITFAMNTTNAYVMFAWLPQILADAGLDAATAGSALGLYAILGLPPALVVPLLAVHLRNPWGVVLFFVACYVVGYGGLMTSPTRPLLLWVVLVGLAPGTFPLLLTLINLRTRTPTGASSLSGFTQGLGYALAGFGPVAVGLLYEATGGWTAVYLLLLCAVTVLAVSSFVACRPVVLEDTWGAGGGSTAPAARESSIPLAP
jgi:CP family cyanate transporter-like MFS transporter